MKVQLREGLIVEAISIEGLLSEEWNQIIIEIVEGCKDLISTGDVFFDGSRVFYRENELEPEIKDDMIIISYL